MKAFFVASLWASLFVLGCTAAPPSDDLSVATDDPSVGPDDPTLTVDLTGATPQIRLDFPGGILCVTSDDCSVGQLCRLDEHAAYRCTADSLVPDGPRGPQGQPPPPPGLLEAEALTGGGL